MRTATKRAERVGEAVSGAYTPHASQNRACLGHPRFTVFFGTEEVYNCRRSGTHSRQRRTEGSGACDVMAVAFLPLTSAARSEEDLCFGLPDCFSLPVPCSASHPISYLSTSPTTSRARPPASIR